MANQSKRKNILLIVVDQWRGDMLSYLGTPGLKTPNLDMLCREGVTFRNHFTQAVPCGPARASLLTGLYQMTHRAVQNTIPLDSRFTNLGHELRKSGYDPALIGYTTTTPDPRTTGPNDPRFFVLGDIMDGFRPVGAFEPYKEAYFAWIAAKGYKLPDNPEDVWRPAAGQPGATRSAGQLPKELTDTAWFTERALTYMTGASNRNWFLHLGYYRPHPPFIAPEPYNTMYDPVAMAPPVRAATAGEAAANHPLHKFYIDNINQRGFFQGADGLGSAMDEEAVRVMRATYFGLMTEIDDHLGRVFDFLKQTGQWDDTLIVFTCDHGEQLGDHYLLGKVGYFDASFRIPMIIRNPDRPADATRGEIVDRYTETVDTMPTILEWIGADIPRQCDGRSLLDFTYGTVPADWRTEVHYEFDFRDIFYSKPEGVLGTAMDQSSLAVVQDDDYKYVHFAALPPLFFDLKKDPGQLQNVAGDPAYAPKIMEYAQKMLDWRLRYADKTLTGYRASPHGLETRR
ncbi:alkaline phosphatase family protein [Ferrovibrio xuzhouensis]|uniref:Alkaline phosphatase family protein n=1 Tax=Ferrovibrio xuzhouensis TaxID=1576914 RepID=A0ABV7VFN3_9PROT